jgi:hypothetical protein
MRFVGRDGGVARRPRSKPAFITRFMYLTPQPHERPVQCSGFSLCAAIGLQSCVSKVIEFVKDKARN